MPPPTAKFTTRARVVDLLGREQIADAPTAMGELFKNAVDALASKVRVEYWQKEKCLVVADDGLGMRPDEDLLAKWLVLATDSKQPGAAQSEDWMKFASEEQRRKKREGKTFGQKGIGRLAMALLGTGTLVWTRWGVGAEAQRTLLLVPWSVFRHPKLTLDQIELPILHLDRAATKEDAISLVKQCQDWVMASDLVQSNSFTQLPLLTRDLEAEFLRSLAAPLVFDDSPGTTFFVLNTDDVVANHFEGWLGKDDLFGEDDSFSAEGPKAYLAFNNPFAASGPRLNIELWCDGRLSKGNSRDFWQRDDFTVVDHYVRVTIDESGFARGIVRRFSEEIAFEQQLKRLPPRASSPGTLEVEVGEVEGDPKTTFMPAEAWSRYYKRAERYGGFYVYVDDVRVCPYGRDDADFLGFEKRRTLSAGRHFWSHRRMFGGVFLRSDGNPDLTEKAGREGFQQNGAYRGLVHYLQALFIELADSYFGSKAKRPDKEAKREEKARIERETRQERERTEFLERFAVSKRHIESVATDFEKACAEVEQSIAKAESGLAGMLVDGCKEGLGQLRLSYQRLWDTMVTQFPTGFSLSVEDAEAIDRYLHRRVEIDQTAQQRLKQLASRLDRLSAQTEDNSARSSRVRSEIAQNRQRLEVTLRSKEKEVLEAGDGVRSSIRDSIKEDMARVDQLAEVIHQSEAQLPEGDVVEEVIAQQTRFVQEERLPYYEAVKKQLVQLVVGDGGMIEAADLREELRVMRDRERNFLELAQLGLVMESADHDYRSMLTDADKAMDELARAIPESSKQTLQNLRDALQHIDIQLQAFDPLVRRVRGRVSEVSGEDIRQFIQTAFDKVRRPTVAFEYTPNFLKSVFAEVKRPVFLGAVHNLVMNAGYWATKSKPKGRVRFSMTANGFVISDSGNGVHERDRDRLFEPGFSRRPAGRGLGLYIARSCFQTFGYQLELLPAPASGALPGANFLVSRPQSTDHDLD
ncbi:MAG: ATP-binding protein [Prosthecobacter sp.]|jgi:signal transduction histidine kinase|uniref:sensor histidine kinase n=1 Tax=Prosthecobacter sp. TaxID=1965333 RepID=UPI0019FC8C78|nr:ATP-binding protein [Prosthecobacter sp.]MBE2285411.1 ATP-binding protein [Prosthecobacter sp.]